MESTEIEFEYTCCDSLAIRPDGKRYTIHYATFYVDDMSFTICLGIGDWTWTTICGALAKEQYGSRCECFYLNDDQRCYNTKEDAISAAMEYFQEHQAEMVKEVHDALERRRNKSLAQSKRRRERTGPDWRNLRKQVLIEEPLCRICGKAISIHVDHIIPLFMGGSNERENLQGLCKACHLAKHKRD